MSPETSSLPRAAVREGQHLAGCRRSRWSVERPDIDYEPVAHIALENAFVSLVDHVHRDDLDIRDDAMCRAEVEHFLCFADSPDERGGQALSTQQEAECVDGYRA